MSGPIRGIDGKLLVLEKGATGEPVVVGYVDSYSIKPSKDVQEISKINADSKEFISGLIGATCSAASISSSNSTRTAPLRRSARQTWS
jgi:hypothetical protein